MSRVHVIALGGTIASTTTEPGSAVTPGITGEQLTAAVPQLADVAAITTEQLAQVGSASLTLDIIREVARATERAAAGGADGVVITQGTDTLEETAYALSTLNPTDAPIVVTGAMRNPTLAGADGPANLLAAVTTAASPDCRGISALAVFADEIHDPLWVHKSHISSTATFTSAPQAGPLGWVHEGAVRLGYRPAPAPRVAIPGGDIPAVALIQAGLGDDLRILDALPAAGYRGVVISGVGGGHVHTDTVDRISALVAQMPVVLASRTGSGHMLAATYGYPGGEIDLLARGLRSAGPLSAPKARLLLAFLLANDALDSWPY